MCPFSQDHVSLSKTSSLSKASATSEPLPRLIVDTAVISLSNAKVAVTALEVTLFSSAAVKLNPSIRPTELSSNEKFTSFGLRETLLSPYVAVIEISTVFPNGTVIVSLSKISLSGTTT